MMQTEGKRGKVMILDPKLAGPLGLVIEINLLKVCYLEKTFKYFEKITNPSFH
jgi:hypothetical protein